MKLSIALSWIIGSALLVVGSFNLGMKSYFRHKHERALNSRYQIKRVIQTGPQRTPLKTSFLAELIGLSANKPSPIGTFDEELAAKKLLACPVIKEATVSLREPDTIYIDYTVRQPVALLYDYDNAAIDEEGVVFPLFPFYTPKRLPEIYLGIQGIHFFTPLEGPKVELALKILRMLSFQNIYIRRIDVSKALAPTLGEREIVLMVQEDVLTHFLRLSVKDFAQEIGNYLELRSKLPKDPLVIDLKIPNLGYYKAYDSNPVDRPKS
jgi:hypothetical protein